MIFKIIYLLWWWCVRYFVSHLAYGGHSFKSKKNVISYHLAYGLKTKFCILEFVTQPVSCSYLYKKDTRVGTFKESKVCRQ